MSYKSKKNKVKIGGDMSSGSNNNINNINNTVPPALRDNLKKIADILIQLFNNVGMYTLKRIENGVSNTSRSFGIDPNNSLKDEMMKVGEKVEKINKVLDTPEGRRALANLRLLLDKISKEVIIPDSEKLANQLIEHVPPILTKGQNAIFDLLSASPLGPFFDIPKLVADSVGVVEKSATLMNEALGTFEETSNKLKAEKGRFNEIAADFNSLIEKGNEKMSENLDYIQKKVDTSAGMSFDKDFKKYQQEAKIIGGRLQKSKDNFWASHVNSSKILQQYGGKNYTKRTHRLRRKLTSRRH